MTLVIGSCHIEKNNKEKLLSMPLDEFYEIIDQTATDYIRRFEPIEIDE